MSLHASSYIKNASRKENYIFQSVSRNEKSDENPIPLSGWISQNENILIERQGSTVDSKKEVREIQFRLTGRLTEFFPLLRGIAGSGQPPSIFLKTNLKEKNFTLQFDASVEVGAKKYLSKVLSIIEDEVRFKQLLRKIILNQEKFHREEKLLLNELSK